jgi:hypothetical protein
MKRNCIRVSIILTVGLLQCINFYGHAQFLKPRAITAAYFGETITHPGIRIGGDFSIVEWNKKSQDANAAGQLRGLYLSPAIGFFYHRDYQTSIVTAVNVNYLKRTKHDNFVSFFLGGGMMNSFIPNVYQLNNGNIEKVGYNSNYSVLSFGTAFGKKIRKNSNRPLDLFAKPSFMRASPSAAGGVWYFMTELGIQRTLW